MKKDFDAYAEIKERVLSLDYPPGTRLSEARLAAELGVGRSPIRTALQRLELEGWVNVLPQSGTMVAELSAEDVAELSELRMLLESHAARTAASRLGDEALEHLRAAYDSLVAKQPAELAQLEAFDDLFHETLYNHANNERIQAILLNLRDQVRWVRRANAIHSNRLADSLAEMGAVLAALEARDGTAAADLMAAHIRNIGAAFQKTKKTERCA